MTKKLPQHQVIRGARVLDVGRRSAALADILVGGDAIVEVGAPGMDAPADAVFVDATDRLVMPGLVNAHTHGHGSLGKGLGDKWSLELLLHASPWVSGGFTLEDKHAAALLNAAEMVAKGCTAAYDMYFEAPTATVEGLSAIGRAYEEVGVRVVLAPMMADITLYHAIPGLLDALPAEHRMEVERMSAAPHAEQLAVCGRMLERWPFARDRVRPALGPTIPLHCSDEFIRGCRDLAEDFGCGVQMHLAESKAQAVSGLRRYGKSLAAHLDELGLLGPRFTAAHGVWLDDDDLARMRNRGATIAHNPGSNLRLGSGIAPAARMLALGVGVGIGTDGSASSDNQNMFEAMRMAAFVSRLVTPDPEGWLGTWEVLELGTAGGAAVLGLGDMIGRVAPGYKADLLFLDLGNVNFVPLNDAANQIVNCEDSSAIDSVMIGGRMVMVGRRFTSFDFDALRRRVAAIAARRREETAASRERMQAMAAFVSHHCIGLTREHYHVQRRLDSPEESGSST
jgi:cytosine/adenosine deaminase-related metal-dependent hydrolase